MEVRRRGGDPRQGSNDVAQADRGPSARIGGTHPWFLDQGERRFPGRSLVREQPWTDGNLVEPLVHGKTYFARLAAELEALAPGDLVCVADWRGDDDERLTDAGPTLAVLLTQLARRGVDVRGLLWRSHPKGLGFNEEEQTELAQIVSAAGGTVLLDERVRRAGSHHQKLVVVHRPTDPDADIAFVGGIDLCHGRRDDVAHLGDQQAEHLDRRYGERAPWHDVQAAVAGPAVAQLLETFRERWNDPTPVERRSSPLGWFRPRVARQQTVPDTIPPADRAPAPRGTHAVQVLRTYPARRPGYPFAPKGERTIATFYRKAFARATSLVYIEDQYFWSREVGEALADALRRNRDLRIIVVVPRFPDRDGVVTGPAHRMGQHRTLTMVREAGGERVAAYDIENDRGTPIYVHAKVVVIDDEVALLGSDNLNRRSWTHDSELSIAVVDNERDDRQPSDPGGRGDGARRFARSLRLELEREHLGSADGADPAPIATFERWRACAGSLDAWYASGRTGPRPPGRVRPHRVERVAWWQLLYAVPLYNLLIDPDGRPGAPGLRGQSVFGGR
jgi:phosphatidylserine/phosphatidylglycerophosphate/cardiolipin synthase-like enzyme